MKTRREFMAGAALMAMGAAVGAGKAVKEYGPVYFHADIFGPVKLETVVSADDERNVFEIRFLSKEGSDLFVKLDLRKIRSVAEWGNASMTAKLSNSDGEKCSVPVYAANVLNKMSFTTAWPGDRLSTGFWVALEDVKRVL